MSLKKAIELHELAKREGTRYTRRRFLFNELSRKPGRHFTGIAGPRGVGKTVLLRQYALEHADAFYLSADTLDPEDDLWELIRQLKDHYGFTRFLLDEIHFLPAATALLKRLYDFLDIHVIFSSSVALAMRASAHDLSRRVQLLELHAFSFREYLALAQGITVPPLTMAQIAAGEWTPEHLQAGRFFDPYLTGGVLPFSLDEPAPLEFLAAIIEKVIARDIPTVGRLLVEELDCLRRLLRFVGRSAVDGINYSSLSRNLGITKYKAAQYVDLLERAFILQQVFPAGTNVLREPKVLMAPPVRLLYRDETDAIGGLREDFAAGALHQTGHSLQYLKSTRGAKTPDYLVETSSGRYVMEVGGRRKGKEQFKGIDAPSKLVFAHSLVPEKHRLPLFLLGYLG